jgi:hypothetical protein
MNALFNGNFFDGSPENIIIWLLLGILFGLPLYFFSFFGQNKSRETNEEKRALEQNFSTREYDESREMDSFEVAYQRKTIIDCSNPKCKALNPAGSKTCWSCDASLDDVITGNKLDSSLKKLNNEKESTLKILDDIDKSLVQGNVSESMYKDLKAKYELRLKQIEQEILKTTKDLETLQQSKLERVS